MGGVGVGVGADVATGLEAGLAGRRADAAAVALEAVAADFAAGAGRIGAAEFIVGERVHAETATEELPLRTRRLALALAFAFALALAGSGSAAHPHTQNQSKYRQHTTHHGKPRLGGIHCSDLFGSNIIIDNHI